MTSVLLWAFREDVSMHSLSGLLLLLLVGQQAWGQIQNEPELAEGFLVTLNKAFSTLQGFDLDEFGRTLESMGVEVFRYWKIGRLAIYYVDGADQQLEMIRLLPEVELVEPNMVGHGTDLGYGGEVCLTDNLMSDNWGVTRVGVTDAVPGAGDWPAEGIPYIYEDYLDDVDMYVIDSGIRLTHVEFEGRASWAFTAPGTRIRDSGFPDPDGDNHGHGTHVAGTTSGALYGVARNSFPISVKVLDSQNSCTSTDVVDAVNWIMQNRDPARKGLANFSIGFSSGSTTVDNIILEGIESGCQFSVSGGNSGVSACNPSPARLGGDNSDMICVGATDRTDSLASFSNYGECIDILGPGVSIVSAGHSSDTALATFSGTSMAAPMVAGTIARHMAEVSGIMSPAEQKAWVISTSIEDAIDMSPPAVSNTPNRMIYAECSLQK